MLNNLKLTKLVHAKQQDPLYWSDAEKEFLRENPQLTVKEFALYLNRTSDAVRCMLYKLELPYNCKRAWTTKEVSFLRENQHLSHAQIAKELDKSRGAVIEMHKRLNLPSKLKRKRKIGMTKEQFDALLEWIDAKIDDNIARANGEDVSYGEYKLREKLEKLLVVEEVTTND